jgi:glutamate synthase domain-containing protein 3
VGEVLVADAQRAIRSGGLVETSYPVTNADRAVGTRLSGSVMKRHPDGLPEGTIRVRLAGAVGQSLGAFLAPGIEIRLDGVANDYVGKGLGGGTIIVVPRHAEGDAVPHGAGNAVLYGATAGKLFVAGTVGQRFAVRNSGAEAVVEGCSDHGAEYMTGGTVAILGPVGRNLAAGMTGGQLFVWDPDGTVSPHISDTAPPASRPAADDLDRLRGLIEAHRDATGSGVAARLLDNWHDAGSSFWVLRREQT